MRKLILVCCALFIAALTQAQIEKGDVQLGGSINFNSNDFEAFDNSALRIQPQVGLFVSSTTSVGLTVGFTSIQNTLIDQNSGNPVELTNNLFVFGTYARFHKPVVENLYLFLQPSVLLGTGENEFSTPQTGDINTFNVGLAPGITYFLSPKFALELNFGGLSYNRSKADLNGNETTLTNFSLNMSLANVGVGMSFYIK